uniref:Uncharacterized protein n=1 Tax=Apapanepox virus TaxID=3049969 RepID=A0AAT9UQ61_9POXV
MTKSIVYLHSWLKIMNKQLKFMLLMMDIIVEKMEYNKEIIKYIDSIKHSCSCRVQFPASTNYTMSKLLSLDKSEIIGMFRMNQVNNSVHYIKSKDKLMVYSSYTGPNGITIQVSTPKCTKIIQAEMYSILTIKCNCDYIIECISENDFEVVIFGLRKYEG